VVESAVVETKGTILQFLQDVAKRGIPADVFMGVLGTGHQQLTRGLIGTAHTENKGGTGFLQRFHRLRYQRTGFVDDMHDGPTQYEHRMLRSNQWQIYDAANSEVLL